MLAVRYERDAVDQQSFDKALQRIQGGALPAGRNGAQQRVQFTRRRAATPPVRGGSPGPLRGGPGPSLD